MILAPPLPFSLHLSHSFLSEFYDVEGNRVNQGFIHGRCTLKTFSLITKKVNKIRLLLLVVIGRSRPLSRAMFILINSFILI